MGYKTGQKVPIPGLEVNEDDGCYLLWWGGDGLGGCMPRRRFSKCRRSTEKEVQIRMFQLKEEEVGLLPIYARGELGRPQLFVGTVDNWAAEMIRKATILGLCLQSSL